MSDPTMHEKTGPLGPRDPTWHDVLFWAFLGVLALVFVRLLLGYAHPLIQENAWQ